MGLDTCAPSCSLSEPCSINTCCINNNLYLFQKVWQEEYPFFDDGSADWLQLPADLLYQLGDVHRALPHSGDGTDLQLRGGLHTGYEYVRSRLSACLMHRLGVCYSPLNMHHLISQQ